MLFLLVHLLQFDERESCQRGEERLKCCIPGVKSCWEMVRTNSFQTPWHGFSLPHVPLLLFIMTDAGNVKKGAAAVSMDTAVSDCQNTKPPHFCPTFSCWVLWNLCNLTLFKVCWPFFF